MHFPHTTLRFLTHRVSFHPTLQSPHCMGHIIASFCPHFLASGELLRFLFMPSIETIQIDMNSQLTAQEDFFTSRPPVDLHGHHIISEITNLCMNFIISSSFLP